MNAQLCESVHRLVRCTAVLHFIRLTCLCISNFLRARTKYRQATNLIKKNKTFYTHVRARVRRHYYFFLSGIQQNTVWNITLRFSKGIMLIVWYKGTVSYTGRKSFRWWWLWKKFTVIKYSISYFDKSTLRNKSVRLQRSCNLHFNVNAANCPITTAIVVTHLGKNICYIV